MMERNPSQAMLHLFVGCFVVAVGLFAAWSTYASLMFLSLGGVMFSFAALHALPDGPSRARTVARVLSIVFVAVTIPLAVTAVLSEVQ